MEAMGLEFHRLFDGVYCGKTVLVTGHTGFKGSWLSLWLHLMGANVVGYALPPAGNNGNYARCALRDRITDIQGDVRDKAHLRKVFETYQPDIVFHLAAQAIVRDSYVTPVETFETNVMGTANVLENIRLTDSVSTGLIITSDKCYENREQLWGYREGDALGGYDPYSASKGCAELVTAAYRNSFFASGQGTPKPVSTARAGNVIGGGDWSAHRIIPDCIRALLADIPIGIRNPLAVRPWQFVLEPLYGYLLLASKMLQSPAHYSGAWNFGPDFDSIVPVSRIVETVIRLWGKGQWQDQSDKLAAHEAGLLNLDCTKAKALLGWKPRISLDEALAETLAWYKGFETEDVYALCQSQIARYCAQCAAQERRGSA
jgi:CDP-glucose 4,6-dehydratase